MAAPWAPRASRRTRLLLAAFLWTGIGTGLLTAGVRWLLAAPSPTWLAALPLSLAAGWAKGRFLLGPRVDRNSQRLAQGDERRCVGGVFSWGSWGVALLMMTGGMLLRRSALPRPWLGLLYAAVGAALLTASARAWGRFRAQLSG